MKQVRVLVVEDVDSMRHLLQMVLERIPGVEVCGTAKNVWEARREIHRHRPDVILLDEILPGESSGDFLQEALGQGLRVYLLTGMEDDTRELPEGAQGRLLKPGWESWDREQARFEKALTRALRAPGLAGAPADEE